MIVLLILLVQFWLFLKAPLSSRFTAYYLRAVFQNKLDYIFNYFDSVSIFLFGGTYHPSDLGSYWGGDKQLISFCYTYGIIFIAPLFSLQ